MEAQESEALDILESMLNVADMKNTGPMYSDDPPRSGLGRIPEDDAAKLRQYISARRSAPENEPCTNCSGIVYRQTSSGKIIPADQRCGAKITPPCYQPDGDGCAYQIYGDNNDEPIDRCKFCPLCYSDKVRHSSLKSKALTCEGCESEYSDEMCEHCSRAIRDDLYARRPEGSETNG